MAGKVFASVSMSLDGFIAPASLADLMGKQWMELHQWISGDRDVRIAGGAEAILQYVYAGLPA